MRILSIFTVLTSLLLAACVSKTGNNQTASGDSTGNAPVETKRANTLYKPAFVGQTRIASIKTVAPYNGKVITDKLRSPWGLGLLPDGRFLVTEKAGNMRIVQTDGSLSDQISGIPSVNDAGQGGLMGIAIDPDFEKNRMVYWSFTENVTGGNHTSIAKGRLSEDEKTMENATVIYRATPAYDGDKHFGGRLVVAASGNLFISTGERSDLETRPQAQDLNSALGKIIHISKDGQPVAGNPFIGKAGARPEIYSYGHRNVEGLAIHPVTGDLWDGEMGPRGGDEINLIKPSLNYGWPTITYGIEYSGEKIGEGITKQNGLEQPVYYWDPVLSPSGMCFYNSDSIPEWKNNLFITGLSSQHIARLVIENNKVVGEERILADEGQRFRDVAQGNDGALYAITDAGKMYRIAAE